MPTSKLVRGLAASIVVASLSLSAVACTADSTGELDRGDLITELEDRGMSPEAAECAAEAVISADFTKDEYQAFNAGQAIADTEKAKFYEESLAACTPG
ncbi:MAG: hypothetical protein KDA94_03960 [Acidimicrobiales bacterium]|nr:hypothetical protein [Acidimicrobiales bacterium]